MRTKVTAKTMHGVKARDLSRTTEEAQAKSDAAHFKIRVWNRWIAAAGSNSFANPSEGTGKALPRPKASRVEHDRDIQPGKRSGANPVEDLLQALASCLTTAMVYKAAARGIKIQEIESSLEGNVDLRGFLELDENVRLGYQGIRVHFKVKADVSDECVQEIGQLGPAHSPVFDSLTHSVPVAVTVERL